MYVIAFVNSGRWLANSRVDSQWESSLTHLTCKIVIWLNRSVCDAGYEAGKLRSKRTIFVKKNSLNEFEWHIWMRF